MNASWWRMRKLLVCACLATLPALGVRIVEVAAEVRKDRLAAAAYERGAALHTQQRYEEAAAAFRDAIAVSPRATAAYDALGEAEFRRGRMAEAVAAYRQLMARYPYTYLPEPYRQVGLIELRAGWFEAAALDLTEAVTLDPQDWLAFYWLGHASDRLGNVGAAREAWRRVLLLKPDFEPARVQLQRIDAQRR